MIIRGGRVVGVRGDPGVVGEVGAWVTGSWILGSVPGLGQAPLGLLAYSCSISWGRSVPVMGWLVPLPAPPEG